MYNTKLQGRSRIRRTHNYTWHRRQKQLNPIVTVCNKITKAVRSDKVEFRTRKTRVSHVPGPSAPMHTIVTSQVVEGITPGSRCPIPLEPDNQPPRELRIPTWSTIAPATAASNFGGVVTECL